jgi:hypothetical protein
MIWLRYWLARGLIRSAGANSPLTEKNLGEQERSRLRFFAFIVADGANRNLTLPNLLADVLLHSNHLTA